MPSESYKKYVRLLKELENGRADGSLTEEAEDELLEYMDEVWWNLTAKEVEALDNRVEKADCDPYKDWS